ncbi:MAG TPA: hypothetical protein DHU63_08615, partial [Candidatus Marinimicrobia bacterium]|nr:hypothetical protein [Candidatus Neomarinimicrobiota bacterium]
DKRNRKNIHAITNTIDEVEKPGKTTPTHGMTFEIFTPAPKKRCVLTGENPLKIEKFRGIRKVPTENKKPRDLKDKPEGKAETAADSSMSLMLKVVVIVLLVLAMVAGAFGLTKYVLIPNYTKFKLGNKDDGGITSGRGSQMGQVYTIKSISVNPLFSNGTRFVVAGLAVEFSTKDLDNELKERDPQIRDALIRYYRRHTADQMLDVSFQEKSRTELTKAINSLLTKGKIDSLYYLELILQ